MENFEGAEICGFELAILIRRPECKDFSHFILAPFVYAVVIVFYVLLDDKTILSNIILDVQSSCRKKCFCFPSFYAIKLFCLILLS